MRRPQWVEDRMERQRKFLALPKVCKFEQWLAPLIALILVTSLAGFSILRRGLWIDSKLTSIFQDIPVNVILTIIVVVLGLSSIIVIPTLPLFVLSVIAFSLPINRKELARFVMVGGLCSQERNIKRSKWNQHPFEEIL